jgi:hypothetical protein
MIKGQSFTAYYNKYVVQGGTVISRNDQQMHYVGPDKLIQLYKVNPKECVTIADNVLTTLAPGQVFLAPDETGKYEVPPPVRYPVTVRTVNFMTATTSPTYTYVTYPNDPPKKKRKSSKPKSPTYPYRCGGCGKEAKFTMIGIRRHWRACGRNHDNDR